MRLLLILVASCLRCRLILCRTVARSLARSRFSSSAACKVRVSSKGVRCQVRVSQVRVSSLLLAF